MKQSAYARLAMTLLAGAIFGFGLSLSGMIDPSRVTGFLNVTSGHWDPSLAFVLGGALPGGYPRRDVAAAYGAAGAGPVFPSAGEC